MKIMKLGRLKISFERFYSRFQYVALSIGYDTRTRSLQFQLINWALVIKYEEKHR